jgi:hypothetical protein
MTFFLTTLPLWLSAVILIVPTTLLAMAGPVIVRRYVDVNQLRDLRGSSRILAAETIRV